MREYRGDGLIFRGNTAVALSLSFAIRFGQVAAWTWQLFNLKFCSSKLHLFPNLCTFYLSQTPNACSTVEKSVIYVLSIWLNVVRGLGRVWGQHDRRWWGDGDDIEWGGWGWIQNMWGWMGMETKNCPRAALSFILLKFASASGVWNQLPPDQPSSFSLRLLNWLICHSACYNSKINSQWTAN